MLSHLVHHLLQLQIGLKMLSLPYKPSNPRPLSPKLQLLAVIVLGNPLHSSAFQEKLKRSSSQSGNLKLPQNTNLSLSKKWKDFCLQERENCYTPSVNSILKILYYLYKNACYYSGLSYVCSALPTIVHIEGCSKLSDHPVISKFMKDIYNQHPNLLPVMSMFGTLIYCWLILIPYLLILNGL